MSDPSTTSVTEFIQSSIKQIQDGLPQGAIIEGSIKFDMATFVQREKNGGLDISVLNLGTNIPENQTQRVSVSIKILSDADIIQEATKKAKAQKKQIQSESRKEKFVDQKKHHKNSIQK
jgi:hypothetical protein